MLKATTVLRLFTLGVAALLSACATTPATSSYDTVIAGGTIYDGAGGEPYPGWVAIRGDRIAGIGRDAAPPARDTIDATGLAVAPGFINMLSWATESLLADGRAVSDVKQGVTTEIFGEGWSMGPLNATMKADMLRQQGDIKYDVAWTTLAQYLNHLERRGIAPNVASFVGATTVRIHELGEEDVDPTPQQLAAMRAHVAKAMNEGALGVGSSLIYAPAAYAETPELTALATVSARCGGTYISHMRSEGDRLLEAVDELITIARESGGPAEIYHLKAAGRENWDKLPKAVERVNAARAQGLDITADMYTYTAGATGLYAAMPTWVQAGGHDAWVARLKDPAIRQRVLAEMRTRGDGWENLLYHAGSAENVLLIDFKSEKLKPLTGRTLAEVARQRGKSPEETAIDLVIEDDSRVGAAFFLMSEDNVTKQTALPWMSFGSDEAAPATEGVFLRSSNHPRAYGNFARLLAKYVRDDRALTLPDAIRRMTALPAANLKLKDRGRLVEGYFADLAIFDPAAIQDHSTFDKPHQYATGMRHVLVNGVPVLKDGEHTGATPGRALRGPGYGRCKAI